MRISQTIRRRPANGGDWKTEVEGTILAVEPQATGSWYAHGKNDKYWLLRLQLQKDDGELTRVLLDHNTTITVLDDAQS